MHRCLVGLGVVDEAAIWASLVSAPTRTAHDEPAAGVDGPARHRISRPDSTGTGSPVKRSVDGRCPVLDYSVGGDLLAGSDDEAVTDAEGVDSGRCSVPSRITATSLAPSRAVGATLPRHPLGPSLEIATGEDKSRHPGSDLEEDPAGRHVAVGDEAESVAQAGFAGVAEEQGVQRPAEGGEHTRRRSMCPSSPRQAEVGPRRSGTATPPTPRSAQRA